MKLNVGQRFITKDGIRFSISKIEDNLVIVYLFKKDRYERVGLHVAKQYWVEGWWQLQGSANQIWKELNEA
jgi:hypothetical protein